MPLTEAIWEIDVRLITFDAETYYDTDYSLSKMPTDEYILDPRFQLIGFGLKIDDAPAQWYLNSEDDLVARSVLAGIDWSDAAVICHNTLFDGFILTQRYNVKPKLWMDTLGMCRMLYPYEKSHSLDAMSKLHNLPPKGAFVRSALGKRLPQFTPAELAAYGEYCLGDVDNTYAIAKTCIKRTPAIEFKLIDMTVRMFTEPQFVGDKDLMLKLHREEQERKEQLLRAAETDRDTIMSNSKLAMRLSELGVEPPVKTSKTTGKSTLAMAKSDKAFTSLLEHPDPEVQALVAARLGVKTTIAETRALRMLQTALRGPMPVYLNYWGAKTTGRMSGGNKINWQNIPARGPSAGLRYAICAPVGFKIIVGDSSNIELRVAMVGAGQHDVVEKIRSGADLYCDFASLLFGEVVTKDDKKKRTIGKIAMLSLQYGAGWMTFKEMVRLQSGDVLTDEEAGRVVNLYRAVHAMIVDRWEYCEDVVLRDIYNNGGDMVPVDVPSWCLTTNEGFGVLGSPGVVYKSLHKTKEGDWAYLMGGQHVKLYGGKVWENYCQHVARQIVMWQTARINERYPVALSAHDEAVLVVPDAEVPDAVAYMRECLTMPPPWCGDLIPLACEVGVGQNYGEAGEAK